MLYVTPLADAAARGHMNILQMLLEREANLNSTGEKGKVFIYPCEI